MRCVPVYGVMYVRGGGDGGGLIRQTDSRVDENEQRDGGQTRHDEAADDVELSRSTGHR